MKALIICGDDSSIEKIDATLRKCGLETIIYKWLLKALDNIEEISPDVTIVSVYDYPRHWKTLAQFINSGIGRVFDSVILFTPRGLSEEDEKKAKALGIIGSFNSVEKDELEKLSNIISSISGNKYKIQDTFSEEKTNKTQIFEEKNETKFPIKNFLSVDDFIEDNFDSESKEPVENSKKNSSIHGSLLKRIQELNDKK